MAQSRDYRDALHWLHLFLHCLSRAPAYDPHSWMLCIHVPLECLKVLILFATDAAYTELLCGSDCRGGRFKDTPVPVVLLLPCKALVAQLTEVRAFSSVRPHVLLQ